MAKISEASEELKVLKSKLEVQTVTLAEKSAVCEDYFEELKKGKSSTELALSLCSQPEAYGQAGRILQNGVLWDVTRCCPCKRRCFGGT
jgi:hypothetical protein